MQPQNGALYRVMCAVNNKSYIGITTHTAKYRWSRHVSDAIGQRGRGALANAIRKYGRQSFLLETLVVSDDWDYLCELERNAIVAFQTRSPHGYNLTIGGEGVVGLALEFRLKHWQDPEFRRRHKAAVTAAFNTEAERAARSLRSRARWSEPAYRDLVMATAKAAEDKPGSKERRSAAAKIGWAKRKSAPGVSP